MGSSDHDRKAVVLLSGGLDSSTTLAIAKAEGYELYAVSFDYKQRHQIELASAGMVAAALGAKKHMTVKFDLREIGGSALTSEIEVPKSGIKNEELSTFNLQPSTPIPVTYVPARNTIFLSFALAWSEVLGAEDIFLGANAVDYSGYPDCRSEYLIAFEKMANLATKESVEGKLRFRIRAPLIAMTKSEIIKKGLELGLDYALTWSCYDPRERKNKEISNSNLQPSTPSHVPCGSCDSCLLRKKGFREAGIADPLNIKYQ